MQIKVEKVATRPDDRLCQTVLLQEIHYLVFKTKISGTYLLRSMFVKFMHLGWFHYE